MTDQPIVSSVVAEVAGVAEWRRTVTELLLPLAIEAPEPDAFRASIQRITLSGIRLYTIWATEHRSARTHGLLAEMNDPFYAISHQLEGVSTISQNGNESELHPGDFAVYETTSPYERTFPGESRTLVVFVPQQLINLPPIGLAQIAGLRVGRDEGLGAIVSPFLTGVGDNLDALRGPNGLAMVHSIVDAVSSALSEQLGIVAPTRANAHLEQIMEIREYIMGRLGDSTLTPARIAADHSISPRTLHGLFSEQGTTVSTWMRERRLEMARRDLVDPLCESDAIRTVCERWGFVDPTHFSNAFKLAYGASPRQYRQAAFRAVA